MDLRSQTFDCNTCGQTHRIDIDFDLLTPEQLSGAAPVLTNFICENVARMYRVFGFALDTRVTLFSQDGLEAQSKSLAESLRDQWGSQNFEDKLSRFKKLNLSFIGIPEDYYAFLREIVDSYCCGHFYPAMTSAGALGERILNRLLIKTRDHFKASKHYRDIYRKQSFDNWDKPILILRDWGVISAEVAESFEKLKIHRNDSIHYNEGYAFEENAHSAIMELAQIVDRQFNYTKRTDLFWVFDVPGEIWLRSAQMNTPFVKEFVLPHCAKLTAYCETSSAGIAAGVMAPLAPLSDEEFINARKAKKCA
jgi:hypothetical protein